MILKYVLGLIFFLLSAALFAQPCYRGISTDPDAPVNPECSTLVNTFDWRTEMLPITQSVPDLPYPIPPGGVILSPFWEDEDPAMRFLAEPFYSTYHDFEVEEGWEMLYLDMEYRPAKNYMLC